MEVKLKCGSSIDESRLPEFKFNVGDVVVYFGDIARIIRREHAGVGFYNVYQVEYIDGPHKGIIPNNLIMECEL